MPFQFSRSEREWMEGVMDLAIFYPADSRWLILDWKTNRTGLDTLLTHYAPQLAAFYADLLDRGIDGLLVSKPALAVDVVTDSSS